MNPTDHVLTLMEDAEQNQNWNKAAWIDALSRSTDKARTEYCEDQHDYLHSFETDTEAIWAHGVVIVGTITASWGCVRCYLAPSLRGFWHCGQRAG